MNHSFNTDIATEVGVEAAIIFENIQHGVLRNEKNGENIKDGQAWVYNSRAAWCELFPYLGEKQIRNALERLLAAALIVRGTYSYGAMNRTYWYGLAERAKQFGPKGPNLSSAKRAKPETVINNNSDTTNPHTPKGAGDWESDSLFMKICEAYAAHNASRVDFGKAWEVWGQKRLAEHADALLVALGEFAKLDQWRKEGGKFIPRLSKWLAEGSWRSQAKISKVVTDEELAARAKVVKAGQDAWARMETAKRMGWEPESDDMKAFDMWQQLQKAANVS